VSVACVPVCNYFTADNRVMRTCQFLKANGFDVHVLAIGKAGLPAEETVDGIHVHRFRSSSTQTIKRGVNLTALRTFRAYVAGAVQWTRQHRPSVIHANDWNTLFIGPLSRVPHRTIYDMHELFQDLDYLNFPRVINRTIAGIDRAGLRHADAVITVSAPIQREMQALTNKPVYVVRNVPEARFADGPGVPALTAHLQDGRKHLVFLGALQREKGALYMLQLLAHLPPEFVLDCFSGKTPKNQFFIDEAARLRVSDRVQIFEYIPQAELCATIRFAFAGLSIFVPSSRIYEYALPNKLFEYFLAGLPVITSNAQAQAELVTETGLGLVANLDDARGAAARIASWQPPRVTRDVVEKHGLTWEQEERALARVYSDLGIIT
jgi:glycosyltransferase involved in cell wall biosynthesis